SNGKLVIGDPLKNTSTASQATSAKPTSTSNYSSKNNTPKYTIPNKPPAAQGSINGIKLGLSLPSKEKLKQVEQEEKELQRRLAEIRRTKQSLAGSGSNTQQQRANAPMTSTSGQRRPLPPHLMSASQRAAVQANAPANVSNYFSLKISKLIKRN
ncbi:hypothetical protein HW132_35185, partial [Brasilonema sp. CT11]|nr:hypothetical protein [Brasilonema sp. CT11]